MRFSRVFSIFAAVGSMFAVQQAQAAWTYSSPTATGTCGTIDTTGSTGFTITPVVNKTIYTGLHDIIHLAFVMDSAKARTNATAHADIIFIQRTNGQINYYSDSTKTVTTIGTIPAANMSNQTEDGLVGVAVKRVFDNYIYLYYSHSDGNTTTNTAIHGSFRISRFTMAPTTHIMDMTSEVVILDIPHFPNRWHTAGAMNFDYAGNLYIDVGDNETAFTGPGNTHDLRGDILRIHPEANGTYTIPAGNFAAVSSAAFAAQGRTVLAARYLDSTKVKPEIYVKGTRNAYANNVNPYNGQLVYSQCGPDNQTIYSEKQDNTKQAMFAGWPWWIGTNTVTNTQTSSAQYGKNGTNEPSSGAQWTQYAPTNVNGPIVNTWTAYTGATMGSDTLPPYVQPKFVYAHSGNTCAMGSMIYHYDGRLANPNKPPPQMDNVWLAGDYTGRDVRASKVDSNGTLLGTFNGHFTPGGAQSTSSAGTIQALLEIQQGPDGDIYIVNNNCSGGTGSGPSSNYSDACTGIARIEYTGTACSDTALHPGAPITTAIAQQQIIHDNVGWLHIGANSFSVFANGPHEVHIMDTQGRVLASMKGDGPKDYSIPSDLPANAVYYIQVKTNEGTAIRGFLHL